MSAEIRDFSAAVIIAAKDAEATIARAVRSALADPLAAQVIVVDDGSRDGTSAAARSADDRSGRLEVIRLGENVGPAAARNLAIANSDAPFVAILDSDDYWRPGRLSRMAQQASDSDLIADDLEIAVMPGEKAAQEGEIALVELHLNADVVAETVDHRRQTNLRGDSIRDVRDGDRVVQLRATRHPCALEVIFGEDRQRRLVVGRIIRLEPRDHAAENFARRDDVAAVHREARAELEDGVVLEGKAARVVVLARDVGELHLQR